MNAMNKGKVGNAGAQAGRLLGRMTLGALCGVGLMWTVQMLWPPSKSFVRQFGAQLQDFSRDYPMVVLGLLIGVAGSLLWEAWKK